MHGCLPGIAMIREAASVCLARFYGRGAQYRHKPILPSLVLMFLNLPFANPVSEVDRGCADR